MQLVVPLRRGAAAFLYSVDRDADGVVKFCSGGRGGRQGLYTLYTLRFIKSRHTGSPIMFIMKWVVA
jgi:hypothetical protein